MKTPVSTLTNVIFLCSVVIGCSSDSEPNTSIALVTGRPGSADPFMDSMTAGAMSKATALGVDLLVRPSPDWNPTAQEPVIDALIEEKVGAIVIQPTSGVGTDMTGALRRANDAGIKIITVDTFIGANTYGQGGAADFPLAFIGSNNAEGGKIGCDGLADAVDGTGKVLIVGGGSATTSVVDRERGCRENLATNHPGVLPVNPGGELQGELDAKSWAKRLTVDYLASDPDIKGVFTVAYDIAQGAIEAVAEAGVADSVRVLVFDCNAADAAGIRAGTIYGCIAQKPALMGATGVEFAHNALNGVSALPVYTSTGFVVLNQENVDDAEMAQFVYGSAL